MKKALTITFLGLSALLILDSMNFAHAIALFLLAGVIPGTNLTLSASFTMQLFALLFGFVVARTLIIFKRDNTLRP